MFLLAYVQLGGTSGYGFEPGGGGTLAGLAVSDAAACAAAVRVSERKASLPPALLGAISMAESGRAQPQTGRFGAWPWTINMEGKDFYFETKLAAIEAVQRAQASGVRSIDVGCMQINLMHHPDAFATLDQAFDPWSNADYAAGFLGRLRAATGTWAAATAAYHSMTPELGAEYQRHVAAFLPEGGRYGLLVGAMPAMLLTPRSPPIDPYDVMTPEFRARLRLAATDRVRRDATLRERMNVASPPRRTPVAGLRAAGPTRPMTRQARLMLQASLF